MHFPGKTAHGRLVQVFFAQEKRFLARVHAVEREGPPWRRLVGQPRRPGLPARPALFKGLVMERKMRSERGCFWHRGFLANRCEGAMAPTESHTRVSIMPP